MDIDHGVGVRSDGSRWHCNSIESAETVPAPVPDRMTGLVEAANVVPVRSFDGDIGRLAAYVIVLVALAGIGKAEILIGPSFVGLPVLGSRLVPVRKAPPPLRR